MPEPSKDQKIQEDTLPLLPHQDHFSPGTPNRPQKAVARLALGILALLIFFSLLTSFLLSGCQKTPPATETPEVTEPSAPNGSEKRLYDLMASGESVEKVTASWLEALDNAQTDADKDRLTSRWLDHARYQTMALSRAFYSHEDENLSALYKVYTELFNGQWDPSLIPQIQDPVLKGYFETLDSSFMKIVENGEYVGPGFDYERLSQIEALSEGFQIFFSLYATYSDYMTESIQTGLVPFTAYSGYLMDLEAARNDAATPHLIAHLEPLIRWSYGLYFFGTMGSGPFNYETQSLDDHFEERLRAVIQDAPESALAELGREVLTLAEDSEMFQYHYYDLIQNFRRFGLKSPKGIRTVYDFQPPTSYIARPEFYNFEDPVAMNALTSNLNGLMDGLKAQVRWGTDSNTVYNLSYYLEFANDRWASFQLAASSYDNLTGLNVNQTEVAVFDLRTGQRVTLNQLLEDPSGEAAGRLEALMVQQARSYLNLPAEVQVDASQRFSLGEDYVLAMLPPGTLSEEQAYDLFVDVRYGLAFPAVDVRGRLIGP